MSIRDLVRGIGGPYAYRWWDSLPVVIRARLRAILDSMKGTPRYAY